MPRIFKMGKKYTVAHTVGTARLDDTSFQKAAWSQEGKLEKLANYKRISAASGIQMRENLAVIGFNQNNGALIRVVDGPDADLLTKLDGNALITNTRTALMGWAADCCLVALATFDGEWVAVLHASVKTFQAGIIPAVVNALRERSDSHIVAYIGACAGSCCYEYGMAQANADFQGYEDFIRPNPTPGKALLDLHGAVRHSLEQLGVSVVELFADYERCSICAKKNGRFMFPSFRRDIDADGKHVNGQYALTIQKC